MLVSTVQQSESATCAHAPTGALTHTHTHTHTRTHTYICCCCYLVAKSYLTLCHPMNCSQPGSSVHGISQARILEWVCPSLLQGIFPTQGSNPGLLHCRQILYHLSCQGSPSGFCFLQEAFQHKPSSSRIYEKWRFPTECHQEETKSVANGKWAINLKTVTC